MSFNGTLEHIPLVEVVQLLHMTAKSGVLTLKSQKGESQLVFSNGFFVGANHLNNSVRIGQVLLEMNAISKEQLEEALVLQKNAGSSSKPLVATLTEQGIIDKETAYKGLETLIEMTIVEVLTWSSGTFSLDVTRTNPSDEYRYFPEKLNQEFLLSAQGILMDALRIYDEKMRDGTLSKIFFTDDGSQPENNVASEDDNDLQITEDLLGLDALDKIAKKVPDVFIGLKDFDPVTEHRRQVISALPEASLDQHDRLISFLTGLSRSTQPDTSAPSTAVILITRNELLSHAVTTLCNKENLFVFSTDEESSLDTIIEQSLARDLYPVLLIDTPHNDEGDMVMTLVNQKTDKYSQISVIVAACNHIWSSIGIQAMGSGARSVIPRPCRQCRSDSYVQQMINFISSLAPILKTIRPGYPKELQQLFLENFKELKSLSTPPEIALVILKYTASQFERAITFVVSKSELVAEKSIGVTGTKAEGPTPPLMFKIPINETSLFKEVVESGRLYYGQRSDNLLTTCLYSEIDSPRAPKVLIMPLISRGRVIALIYADFGSKPVCPPQIGLLEALSQHAGSILDNAIYRKHVEKPA